MKKKHNNNSGGEPGRGHEKRDIGGGDSPPRAA